MKFSALTQEQGMRYVSPFTRQLMRISFLTAFLFFSTLQFLLAVPAHGQDMTVEKVTVGLNQEELFSAFKQIERQTSLRFFYRKAELARLGKFSMAPARRTVQLTLFEMLLHSGLSFRQVDQNILIEANNTFGTSNIRVSGKVLASDHKQPLRGALVELLSSADLQLAGQAFTDSTGHFELSTQDTRPHLIRVSLMGYHLYRAVVADGSEVTVPDILLEPDPKVLAEVVIASSSPLVKQEVDRLVYNVQADPDNKTITALEILARVPLISVDADGNIKLKGSSSFQVLIDGHTSSLVVSDPKEIFRVMPASSIASIEVITIPPAKYDSEGLAGIINIVTVKKKFDGYNGNLSFQYKFPNGPRSSANFTLKSGKFAMSVLGGYNIYNTPQTSFSIARQSTDPAGSAIDQRGTAHTDGHQSILYSQYSYEIDSLNLLSALINFSEGGVHRLGSVVTREMNPTYSSYELDDDDRATQHGYELGLDYQKGFQRNKTQLFSFSYRYSDHSNHQVNQLTAINQVNSGIGDYSQENTSGTQEHTLQADYTQPLKQVQMETGIKTIFRTNFSDYPGDNFTYDQAIYAAYNSYQLNLHSWTVKAGARLELTAQQAGDYNRVVPAIAVQKKLSSSTSINFGYSERISRPGIAQLNPYVDRQNPLSISYGNPNLRPELNHTFSFNYSAYGSGAFNAGVSYSFSNNAIQFISLLDAIGITDNTYANLGRNATLSGYISLNYPLNPHVNLIANAEIRQVHLDGMIGGSNYNKNALAGNSIIDLYYKWAHDWRSGLEFQYYSPNINLQSSSSPYYYSSVSLSKTINKKLTVSASASNPYLKYLDYHTNYTDPHYTQVTHNEIVYRRFNLNLNYSFGKLRNSSVKKNQKPVKNDDTSTAAPPSPPGN